MHACSTDSGGFRKRTVARRVTVTNPKGTFSIRGIATVDYNVFASRSLEAAALEDPGLLEQAKTTRQTYLHS